MIVTLMFDDEKENDMEKFQMMHKVQDFSSMINEFVDYISTKKSKALNKKCYQALDEVQEWIGYQIERRDLEHLLKISNDRNFFHTDT